MNMTEWFREQLAAEADRSRRVLAHVPVGREEWAPHERSMAFGRLAGLVATMPSWIPMIVEQDDLELAPPEGRAEEPPLRGGTELVAAHDTAVARADAVLAATTDDHLVKPWRLLVEGAPVSEAPRFVVLRDTFCHLAHHRGQLTVYLRLADAPVGATYGPSADDATFG